MEAIPTTVHNPKLPTAHSTANLSRFAIAPLCDHQDLLGDARLPLKISNLATRLTTSLAHLLKIPIESHLQRSLSNSECRWTSVFDNKSNTPTTSPKENISDKWYEIQGSDDWVGLLDPLHPWLRREIIKYGELAQATYDAFDFDSSSEYCGSCRYSIHKLFEKLGLVRHGYNVTKYIYAMSHLDLPGWMERSLLTNTWSKDSNWMGFVAVSDDEESHRIGRRDIVVAWRGTVAPSEWYEDLQRNMEPVGPGVSKVEQGFHSIYTSKNESTRYNKSSASEQVMQEVARLVDFYKSRGEQVSLTITGHSLGGALALINAYEAANTFPDLNVGVVSFGAPRVGNHGFKQELDQMGVKVLRVVIKQDVVPRMPGIVFNEHILHFNESSNTPEWVYTHVGTELKLDASHSPFLKHGMMQFQGHHMLETYLHLVDGFSSLKFPFRSEARRDIALVNKECDMLINQLRIPPCWYQAANKGLVMNGHGRWIKPKRDPEIIPSPGKEHDQHPSSLAV